jgi:hypothetical protein
MMRTLTHDEINQVAGGFGGYWGPPGDPGDDDPNTPNDDGDNVTFVVPMPDGTTRTFIGEDADGNGRPDAFESSIDRLVMQNASMQQLLSEEWRAENLTTDTSPELVITYENQ